MPIKDKSKPADAASRSKPEADLPAGLRLEWMDPAHLVANASNWRRHPESQSLALSAALKEVGWAGALLFNERTGHLIDGHLRKEITPGGEKVPVLVGSWTEDQEKIILATLDPLGAMAERDQPALDKLLASISVNDPDLKRMFDEMQTAVPPALVEDEAPIDRADELQKKWQTAAGQLWEIPSKTVPPRSVHKLLCGDSTNGEDVRRVMGGAKADLLATDPPYLVDYTGDRPNDSGKDWSDSYHEIDIKDAYAFYKAVFVNALDVMGEHVAIYCWHAHKRAGVIQRVWAEIGILDHQEIVWIKPTPVFGRVFWHFQHEPCMMGWRQGFVPVHDGDQTISSVWEIDYDGKGRVVGNDHPTQKPLEIFARPMRKHTKPGGICFEPFSGSGSQLVAAEQLGRLCYAIEIEPKFLAVALERLANLGLAPALCAA